MKNNDKLRWILLTASLAALALGSGCDDSSDNPSPGNTTIGGTKGNAGSGNNAGTGPASHGRVSATR